MFGHNFKEVMLKRKPEKNLNDNTSKYVKPDEIFDPNYTIHLSLDFFGQELRNSYPARIFYLTNKEDMFLGLDEIQALELYSNYTSKQCKLEHPIFSYNQYKTAGITFYAFLIQLRLSIRSIQLVLFFDNYETQNKDTFQLRFEWWQPGTRDLHNTFEKAIDCIQNKLQVETVIATKKTFVRKFSTEPFNFSLLTFPNTIPEGFSLQIQLPFLDLQEWQAFKPILDENNHSILGGNHTCLLATGNILAAAQQMAERLAGYLREDEGYDTLTYRTSEENEHDIYFIMKTDLSVCVGVFVFSNEGKDYSKILQQVKNIKNSSSYQESDPDFFKSKIYELQNLHAKCNEKTLLEFRLSTLIYNFFYLHSKDHFPEDTKHIKILTTAWIHPFHRNEGILTKLWPIFIKKYGVFDIDCPSDAFRNFLKKHNIPCINLSNLHVLVTAMPTPVPAHDTASNNNNNQPAPTQNSRQEENEKREFEEPTPHSPGASN